MVSGKDRMNAPEQVPVTAVVITCSDTAHGDPGHDRSGPLAARILAQWGLSATGSVIVPDDVPAIATAVRQALLGHRLVVCTGGTGLGPRDVTPEAVSSLGGRAIPGLGEAIRAAARATVPTTDLSRVGGWAIGDGLVLVLPGSTGGVRDSLAVAGPLLTHALQMLAGGGHGRHGSDASRQSKVSSAQIDAYAVTAGVRRAAAGATVTFEGRVRDHDHDRPVTRLRYEAHPSAEQVLAGLVEQSQQRPGVLAADGRHRTGDLAIGDLAFFVAVSAAHRADALDACSWLVEEAKARLPIWKLQVFSDGTREWVNCA